MTSPFPFDAWAKPGKEAFDFWISFFPTAPLFGVEWRFAEMVGPMADPTINPFLQAGPAPFAMTFPGTTPVGAAARPGELASPAAADERHGRPVAKATGAAADAASQATRVAAETGKAAARTAEATAKAADAGGKAPAKPAEKTAERAEPKAEARAAVPATAKTAVEAAAPAAVKGGEAEPEVVESAVAAAPKPKGLLAKRPDDADDLKMLKGVGPGLEKQLNELGVWKLEQLAKMSDTDLAWIDANLTSFKGRCFRDDWVGQAKSRLKN